MTSSFLRVLAGSRRGLACVLILSLGLLVFASPFAAAQDAPDAEEAAAEQAAPGGEATDDGESGEAAAEEAEPAAGPWNVSEPCANVQHPYQADVCQQARAAEASESTARLTRLLMLIGLLALLVLLLMLVPVIMAALAARRAAEGSVSPVRLSSPSESTDREAELRAYVDVDSLEFIETPEADGIVKVKIAYRNSGQTPAFKLESLTEMEVVDIAEDEDLPIRPVPDDGPLAPSRPRLGRDGTATVIIQCDTGPKLADRVTNGEATILVWGAAGYYDVFDRRRRTIFQYFCNAETLETGEMFRPMVRGDEVG